MLLWMVLSCGVSDSSRPTVDTDSSVRDAPAVLGLDQDDDGVPRFGDCDDLLSQVSPFETERMDGFDNDCDGLIDEDQPPHTGYTGCGEQTIGGTGGELYRVTHLQDSGTGSLREGLETHKEGSPRIIVFDVGGEIEVQSLMRVEAGLLTIDGASAPSPGVTLVLGEASSGILEIAAVSDVIVSHLRFEGRWQPGVEGINGVGTLQVFGSNGPGERAERVVLDHITALAANDYGPDLWGEVSDVTVSWSLFYRNRHPMTISDHPAPFAVRDCISVHHNVFAENGERNPQLRGDVRRASVVNNLVYGWGYAHEDRGNGIRIRAEAGEPPVSANIVANYFGETRRAEWALVYGQEPGEDEAEPLGDLYVVDNRLPEAVVDSYGTTDAPLDTPEVLTWPAERLPFRLSSRVGVEHRRAEEIDLLNQLAHLEDPSAAREVQSSSP